jgi:hypothetical protein
MMDEERFHLGAYWGDRRESVEKCAERSADFLAGLGACDQCFAGWFRLGESREQARAHEVPANVDILRAELAAGRNRRDTDGAVIEDLGFSLWLWNGADNDEEAAGLHIACGGYSGAVPNVCSVDLPRGGDAAERVLRGETLTCVIEAAVSSWEPDWARVISNRHLDWYLDHTEDDAVKPVIGWLTYLSAGRGEVPPLPPPTRTVALAGHGTLIILTDERFSATRPDHLDQAARVREILDSKGLLFPTAVPRAVRS